MSLRVASVVALAVLLGCASQTSLMNLDDMSDEVLVSNYHRVDAEIIAAQKELESLSDRGRVIPSAIEQDKLTDLKKTKYRIEGEFTRRRLPIPPSKTPEGEGRY